MNQRFKLKNENICLFVLISDLPILKHDKNPGISYDNLRKIVHTIVQEVIKLPEFYNQNGFSSVDANQVQSSFEPKIYEDLLATAVINKVRNFDCYKATRNIKFEKRSHGFHYEIILILYYLVQFTWRIFFWMMSDLQFDFSILFLNSHNNIYTSTETQTISLSYQISIILCTHYCIAHVHSLLANRFTYLLIETILSMSVILLRTCEHYIVSHFLSYSHSKYYRIKKSHANNIFMP